MMIEDRDVIFAEQAAQAIGLARIGRFGKAEEDIGMRVPSPTASTADSTAMVCISVSAVPPDFEMATKRVV